MTRAPLMIVVAIAAAGCCAQAFGMTSASAVSTQIVEPAGINVVSSLTLPTVSATSVTANGGATSATTPGASGAPGSPAGNAALTIHGQAGDAVSMAVPESFTVVRSGGTDSLTVKTNTNGEFGVADNSVVLGGSVMGGSSMSVNVGGAISLASAERVTPGDYQGLLVVVVQYN